MRMLLISILVLASLSGVAQTAKVVALTPAETAQLKSLTEQKERIDTQLAALKASIVKTHLVVHAGAKHSNCAYQDDGYIAEGWGCGGLFEYSADFRFIVPDTSKAVAGLTLGAFGSNCGWTTTPAMLGNATIVPATSIMW